MFWYKSNISHSGSCTGHAHSNSNGDKSLTFSLTCETSAFIERFAINKRRFGNYIHVNCPHYAEIPSEFFPLWYPLRRGGTMHRWTLSFFLFLFSFLSFFLLVGIGWNGCGVGGWVGVGVFTVRIDNRLTDWCLVRLYFDVTDALSTGPWETNFDSKYYKVRSINSFKYVCKTSASIPGSHMLNEQWKMHHKFRNIVFSVYYHFFFYIVVIFLILLYYS